MNERMVVFFERFEDEARKRVQDKFGKNLPPGDYHQYMEDELRRMVHEIILAARMRHDHSNPD